MKKFLLVILIVLIFAVACYAEVKYSFTSRQSGSGKDCNVSTYFVVKSNLNMITWSVNQAESKEKPIFVIGIFKKNETKPFKYYVCSANEEQLKNINIQPGEYSLSIMSQNCSWVVMTGDGYDVQE
jgi:hypothetical protein